jgi:transcriptional regulator with XRE-family HTH domain
LTDSTSPAHSPAEPVGAILARWRKRTKLTGQALGERVGMSQTKISRLENGLVTAEPSDVRLLAEELGMPPGQVDHLVELAEEHADNRLTEWIPAGSDLASNQHEYGRIEASAKELRIFQPAVAKDEVNDAQFADSTVAVSEAVTARMRRTEVLLVPDHEFHFLITESVLRNRVCRPAEMIAQIDRMRELASYPNIHFGIIADDVELPIAPYHGFVVADDRWVSVDLFNTSLMTKGRSTVRVYRGVFEALKQAAQVDVAEIFDRYQAYYVRMLLPRSVAS